MKTKILIAATFMAVISTAQARKIEEKTVTSLDKGIAKQENGYVSNLRYSNETEPNPRCVNQFLIDFGKMPNVKWTKNAYFDEATFVKHRALTHAFYNSESKLVGTTSDKKFADLPAKAQKEINTKYKGYTKGEIVLFEDNQANDTDMYLFDQQFEDTDSYFISLSNGAKKIILQIDQLGNITFFKDQHPK